MVELDELYRALQEDVLVVVVVVGIGGWYPGGGGGGGGSGGSGLGRASLVIGYGWWED